MTSRSGETRITPAMPIAEAELCLSLLVAKAGGPLASACETVLRELAATRREGWVMVPREPTQSMEVAGGNVLKPYLDEPLSNLPCARKAYRAMLAAAPKEGT